ncbi:hypothetical protein V462_10415 [Pantoea ananatis 15320]|uniref:DUF6685 family protein n=1 Tax=Pantoea ananas TaxID=553 RepID=UPI0004223048|nr:DUF6685 family protein [Pantoea ananatis]PKC36330.1 hypothetical protein V462_10415 [Pantoea ananatis 15320]
MAENIIDSNDSGPVALRLAISSGKLIPQPLVPVAPSACITSVVRWDEWPDYRVIFNKTPRIECFQLDPSGSMEKEQLAVSEIIGLVQEETIENYSCNLTDIAGMSSSGNNISSAKDMEDFAQMFCPDFIKPVTESRLKEMITYFSVKLDDMTFSVFSWADGGLYWNNDNGSHHLAAARHIALQLGMDWSLKGRLYRYTLSKSAVALLRSHWHLVLIPSSAAYSVFMDAMKLDRCPFGISELPQNLHRYEGGDRGLNVVWLDRRDRSAKSVAAVLLDAGFPDLGSVLEGMMNDSRFSG